MLKKMQVYKNPIIGIKIKEQSKAPRQDPKRSTPYINPASFNFSFTKILLAKGN